MIRWALWLLAGLILGGVVHFATVLLLPRTATRDAYARLEPITRVNAFKLLPAPRPDQAVIPFMDPAFATAVCRYDLSRGSVKLIAPVSQAYTSVTFYTRAGIAFYAINDRAAGRRTVELDLMTPAQHEALPTEEDVTAADRLIVESPTPAGLIVVRALIPEPALQPMANAAVSAAQCKEQPDNVPQKVETAPPLPEKPPRKRL
ncbi:MAG: DUF1254 domain-containing protein [Rhodoplanes sp.]|jgi:uncharacterized membrane protein